MRQKNIFLILALLCTMVQGARAQASWEEVCAMTGTTKTDWTQLNAGSTTGQTLGTAGTTTYYYADTNLTFSNSTAGGSGLTIQGKVYLYVPQGVTVTCKGADASGQTGAGAGIELTLGNSIYLFGKGNVNATGGNGAGGGDGTNGSDAGWDSSNYWSGTGGTGGHGGGGAGAGIGTRGGDGGNGGAGAASVVSAYSTAGGGSGAAGQAGATADAMGELYKTDSSGSLTATGGAAASQGGSAGGAGKSILDDDTSNNYGAAGGGGGGAGGFGGAASKIGTGGPGGGGGGGGTSGNLDWAGTGYYVVQAPGGKGGQNADGTWAADGALSILNYENLNNGKAHSNSSGWNNNDSYISSQPVGTEGSGGVSGSFVTNDIVTSETTTMTSGLYYVISDITVTERIQVIGNVTLNLSEGVTLMAKKGIEVSQGNKANLTINGHGALTIDGCDSDKSGIGASAYGYITINGGTVNVTGGSGGAAIGGDYHNVSGQAITINGGVVNARAGLCAAGIGAGMGRGNGDDPAQWGTCGHIYIYGGQVTAIGGGDGNGYISGAGIGAGRSFNQPRAGTLTLGWTNPDDFIYSSGYVSEPGSPMARRLSKIYFVEGKQFIIEGTATIATTDNIGGKKIVPYTAGQTALSGAGTQENPWRITSTADWNALAQNVINKNSYSGEYVRLEADINITRSIGVYNDNAENARPFSGTFLGNGHTLTADITAYNSGMAPFIHISGATIKDLTVAGTITTGQRHSSALVAFASGTNVIESCIVTATINTSTDYTGGFIGHGLTSTTTIRGCVFAGTVNGVGGSRPNVGIFWGWSDSGTPALENCLEAGTYTNLSSMHHMGLQGSSGTITNCYHVTPQIGSPSHACTVSGARQAYAFAATPANLGELVNDYGLAKAYQNGILYDGTYYVIPIPLAGSGTENEPYVINNDYDWNCFAYSVNNGTSYSGEFVELYSDISVSNMAGASETNSFQGTFLGGRHTITAAMTDNINGGAAPFRYIKNATINNLTVTGTITSNQRHMSGLVGFAYSEGEGKNLIEGCTVTATLNINTDYAGGIIGHGKSSATTIRGCVFAGTMNASGNPNVGVIWGWIDNGTPTLENCLEAGTYTGISKLHPMGLQGGSGTIANCYYVTPQIGQTTSNACTVSGAKQAYAFVSALPNLGNLEHNYGTMTVYENGILFDGIYYVASTPVSLADNSNNSTTISNSNGYLANVTLQGRTLYMDGAWNTLCLPFSMDNFTGTPLEGATVKTLASTDFNNGTLTMNFTDNQTSIEAGKPYLVKWEVTDLSTLNADYTAHDGEVLTGKLGGNYKISIAAGATVILQDVTINGTNDVSYQWAGINCLGDATINIKGTNNVKGFQEKYPGIYVPEGSTLTIKGCGVLNASNNGWAAGIGGGFKINCGNIVIEGGTVNAWAGDNSAAIGSGQSASCGYITITNGVSSVTATAASDDLRSIGQGFTGSCGTVTIGVNVGEIKYTYTYTGTGSGSVDMSVNPVFKNVFISNATANAETSYVDFVGTYSPVNIYTAEKSNLYLGGGNMLYYPSTEGYTLNACRGYFQLKGLTAGEPSNSNQASIRAFVLNFGDDTYYMAPVSISLADAGDNSTAIGDANGYLADVTLQGRTLYKDGAWNTLCLPFNVTLAGSPLEGAVARPLTEGGISGTTLNLTFGDAVTELVAGTPYIIKWDGGDDIVSPVFSGVTIDATMHPYDRGEAEGDQRVRFTGTYSSMEFADTDNSILLMGGENMLYHPTTGAGLGAQHAYFKIGGDGAKARRITGFSINFGDGEATGIISAEANSSLSGWYTIDGRRLSGKPTRSGIYINGGRKVVIK